MPYPSPQGDTRIHWLHLFGIGILAAVTLAYLFTYLGIFFIPETNLLENVPENYLLGISPLAFGPIGAALNFAVAYAVSRTAPDAPAEVQALVESVRIPRGAGAATTH